MNGECAAKTLFIFPAEEAQNMSNFAHLQSEWNLEECILFRLKSYISVSMIHIVKQLLIEWYCNTKSNISDYTT